jgi:hypothetical protein
MTDKVRYTPISPEEAASIPKYRVFMLRIGDFMYAIAEQLREWRARGGKRL